MAQCPVCQAPVPDDFGLIECGSCGAQLIVHLDGTVESAGLAAHEEGEPIPAEYQQPLPEPEAEFEAEPDLPDPLADAAPDQDLFESDPDPEPAAEEPLPEPGPEPVEPEPEVYRLPADKPAADPLADIARFGNSDSNSGRDGSLRYNLRIGGIDTADMREAFREALTDRKFMWDIDQILRSIRDGEVSIENVTASKAHVLVSRLRSMPLQIRWEQYVVQQG